MNEMLAEKGRDFIDRSFRGFRNLQLVTHVTLSNVEQEFQKSLIVVMVDGLQSARKFHAYLGRKLRHFGGTIPDCDSAYVTIERKKLNFKDLVAEEVLKNQTIKRSDLYDSWLLEIGAVPAVLSVTGEIPKDTWLDYGYNFNLQLEIFYPYSYFLNMFVEDELDDVVSRIASLIHRICPQSMVNIAIFGNSIDQENNFGIVVSGFDHAAKAQMLIELAIHEIAAIRNTGILNVKLVEDKVSDPKIGNFIVVFS